MPGSDSLGLISQETSYSYLHEELKYNVWWNYQSSEMSKIDSKPENVFKMLN